MVWFIALRARFLHIRARARCAVLVLYHLRGVAFALCRRHNARAATPDCCLPRYNVPPAAFTSRTITALSHATGVGSSAFWFIPPSLRTRWLVHCAARAPRCVFAAAAARTAGVRRLGSRAPLWFIRSRLDCHATAPLYHRAAHRVADALYFRAMPRFVVPLFMVTTCVAFRAAFTVYGYSPAPPSCCAGSGARLPAYCCLLAYHAICAAHLLPFLYGSRWFLPPYYHRFFGSSFYIYVLIPPPSAVRYTFAFRAAVRVRALSPPPLRFTAYFTAAPVICHLITCLL